MNEDFLYILESQFYGSSAWMEIAKSRSARDICQSLEHLLRQGDNLKIYRVRTVKV